MLTNTGTKTGDEERGRGRESERGERETERESEYGERREIYGRKKNISYKSTRCTNSQLTVHKVQDHMIEAE